MKNTFLFLFITLTISANVPLKITGADHQIVFWAFNHQFDKATQLVEDKISENPDNPKYYFLNTVVLSLKHLADSDTLNFEVRYDFRGKKNEELIKYTEGVLEKFEDIKMTPENKFYMANLYGYLGRMHGFTGSYMSAFSNAKEGKDLLEELVEEYPDLYDAYLLLGMFEYYADRLGGITEFIAAVLGFSGERITGLKYLQTAKDKGDLTRPFAEFILAETFSIQEANNFAAVEYFERLVKQYPNNKNFYEWYVRILIQLERLQDAERMIIADEKNHVESYLRGLFYLRVGDLEKGFGLLNDAIESKNFKWGGAYRYSKFLAAVTGLLIDKPVEKYVEEFDDEWTTIYNEIKNNIGVAKEVYRFTSDVGLLDVGTAMDLPKFESLPQNGYLRSLYEYYAGVYFYKYRDATRAILYFSKVAENREYFRTDSAEYLINIYRSINPTEEQLDKLEDVIDDLDNEDLEFSFQDLER